MKKNLKKLLSAFLIAMMAVAITGCGDKEEPAATETPATEAPATEAPEAEDTGSAGEAETADTADEAKEESGDGSSFSGIHLTGGEALVEGTESIVDEKEDNGSYYLQNVSSDGMYAVYQQGGLGFPGDDVTEEEYAMNIATGLSDTGANDDAKVKPSNAYSENLTYPVYVVSFTSGGNEDTRQWWVFVAYTDNGAYLYGINTPADADPDAGALADETFPNLRMG